MKYRPDLFLPVIEFYGGFSEANIQTGAAPAGGFEVGQPAHARQSEPGGVFSLAIPVNEHLRFIAGEFSEHGGDSGFTGLTKPARRLDAYYLMAGPEFMSRRNKWTMFGHFLGGYPVTNFTTPGESQLLVPKGSPVPQKTTLVANDSGIAMMIGGGVEMDISRWLAFRPGQVDFIASRVRRDTSVIGEYTSPWWQYNFKFGAGLVVRVINDNAKRVVQDPGKPLPPRPPRQVVAAENPEGSRWSVHTLFGGAPNVVDDSGILARKPEYEGNGALIGFKDAFVFETNLDFNVTRNFALRGGYQFANVDFGSALDSVPLGTATYHMPKLGLLFTHRENRWNLDAGLLAGPAFYTNIEKSQAATDTFGIQRMTSATGFQVGPGLDLQWNVKRTGLLLGVGGFLPIGLSKAARIKMETAPDSQFESSVARFAPAVFAVSAGYRFR